MEKKYKISIADCPVTRLDVEMNSQDGKFGLIEIKRVYDSNKPVERPVLISVNEAEARALVTALTFMLNDARPIDP